MTHPTGTSPAAPACAPSAIASRMKRSSASWFCSVISRNCCLDWLRARDPERGWFLWLHVFDPHGPYVPPPDFRGGPLQGKPYLGEVAYVDRVLGSFFEELRRDGTLDRSTLLVVADHGEGLGDHGEESHGTHVFESTMRVPLFWRRPGGEGGGRRVSQVVSVVDVYPTLLESLGLPVPGGIDGESLARPRLDRGVYFESYSGYLSFGWSPIAGWLNRDGKYVHSSRPSFFDVFDDPDEAQDLADQVDLRPFQLEIAAVADGETLSASDDSADPELLAELRGLGYAAVASSKGTDLPHPLAPSDRRPPQDTIAEHADFLRAMKLSNARKPAEAEALLRTILSANPHNDFAADLLAFNLNALGRTPEAIRVLEELLDDGPPWPNSWLNLGLCYRAEGRLEDAVEALERAAELAPSDPKILGALVETLRSAGRDATGVEQRLRKSGQ